MNWTYVDDYGKRHNVGLFHGRSSGHLMIYCNTKVLFIDFNVRKSKKYSFLINDEIFDVHVENNEGKFSYGFEIDKKTRTPRNLARSKNQRKDFINGLLFCILLFGLIALGVFLIMRY